MRQLIWIKLFKTSAYYTAHTAILVGHMLICCVIVFFVGTVTDFIYRKFIERKALTYLWGKIDKTKNLPIVTYVMSFLNK